MFSKDKTEVKKLLTVFTTSMPVIVVREEAVDDARNGENLGTTARNRKI